MSKSRFQSPDDLSITDIPFIRSLVNPEEVNIAIAETEDDRTCIYCDYPLQVIPDLVGFDEATSNVYLVGGDFGTEGLCLQYPLDYDKIDIWKREGVTYFALVSEDGVSEVYELDIIFTSTAS